MGWKEGEEVAGSALLSTVSLSGVALWITPPFSEQRLRHMDYEAQSVSMC